MFSHEFPITADIKDPQQPSFVKRKIEYTDANCPYVIKGLTPFEDINQSYGVKNKLLLIQAFKVRENTLMSWARVDLARLAYHVQIPYSKR